MILANICEMYRNFIVLDKFPRCLYLTIYFNNLLFYKVFHEKHHPILAIYYASDVHKSVYFFLTAHSSCVKLLSLVILLLFKTY